MFVRGTYWISDVRDIARLHERLLAGRRHNRYFAPTTTVDVRDYFALLREVTGRSIPSVMLPEAVLRPGLLAGEAAARWLRMPFVWSAAGGWSVDLGHRVDDSRTREEFGLQPTPVRETIADNIRWLADAGHITARLAGRAVTH